jgi:peptidoglycan/xylan/chitin deacetylase (PgdA/CDA1 family)
MGRGGRRYKHHEAEILNVCFHGIGTPERELEKDEAQYWVDSDRFEALLETISRYPIRVTFDDGNASDVTHALPALLRHNLSAAFFLIAGRLDQAGSVTRVGARELARSGMLVGSHGLLHRPFRSLRNDALRRELADATRIIAVATEQPVEEVAVPFGSYDRRVLKAMHDHGFTRVYTCDGGWSRSEAWLQSRYAIRSKDTPATIDRLARSPRGGRFGHAVRTGKTLVKRVR